MLQDYEEESDIRSEEKRNEVRDKSSSSGVIMNNRRNEGTMNIQEGSLSLRERNYQPSAKYP